MRESILILLLFTLPYLKAQEGIEFFHGTWEEALELANKEQKPIFVDAYAVWCGPCKRMAKNVFTQEEVGEFYNTNFINVKMDMERGEGPTFAKSFPVRAYPTLLFISPKGEKYHEHVGGMDGPSFLKLGEQAIRKFGGRAEFADRYEEGRRDFETVLGYIKGMAASSEPTLALTNEYLREHADTLSEDQRRQLIFAGVSEADSKLFEELMRERKEYQKLFGSNKLKAKVESTCNATVQKGIQFRYTPLLDEAVNKYARFQADKDSVEAFRCRSFLQYYSVHPSYDHYLSYVKKYVNTSEGKQVDVQRKIASDLVQIYSDQAYPGAIQLWKKIIKEDPEDAESHYMLAQVYAAIDQQKKAKKMAERALFLADKGTAEYSRYQGFLHQLP